MKRSRTIHTICAILVLTLLTSIVAFAAPQKETFTIEPREILTYTDQVQTENGYVSIEARLSVQQSDSTIVAINNIRVAGWTEGVEKPSVGSATLWQGKTYATVTATFRYNGKVMTDIAYFYP